jgi:hypothetical protein
VEINDEPIIYQILKLIGTNGFLIKEKMENGLICLNQMLELLRGGEKSTKNNSVKLMPAKHGLLWR